MHPAPAPAPFDVFMIEDRQPPLAVLADGFDQRDCVLAAQTAKADFRRLYRTTAAGPAPGRSRTVRRGAARGEPMPALPAGPVSRVSDWRMP